MTIYIHICYTSACKSNHAHADPLRANRWANPPGMPRELSELPTTLATANAAARAQGRYITVPPACQVGLPDDSLPEDQHVHDLTCWQRFSISTYTHICIGRRPCRRTPSTALATALAGSPAREGMCLLVHSCHPSSSSALLPHIGPMYSTGMYKMCITAKNEVHAAKEQNVCIKCKSQHDCMTYASTGHTACASFLGRTDESILPLIPIT